MAASEPNAISINARLHPQTLGTRLTWLVLGVGATLVVGISRWLTPSATGLGTHQQLGLPACGFHAWTGLPCPGCGLTTAFAHMARGHWHAAFDAHWLGPLLFALTVLVIPAAGWAAIRATSVSQVFAHTSLRRGVYLLAALLGFAWVIRLAHILSA
jgi:hypothetical protein